MDIGETIMHECSERLEAKKIEIKRLLVKHKGYKGIDPVLGYTVVLPPLDSEDD